MIYPDFSTSCQGHNTIWYPQNGCVFLEVQPPNMGLFRRIRRLRRRRRVSPSFFTHKKGWWSAKHGGLTNKRIWWLESQQCGLSPNNWWILVTCQTSGFNQQNKITLWPETGMWSEAMPRLANKHAERGFQQCKWWLWPIDSKEPENDSGTEC